MKYPYSGLLIAREAPDLNDPQYQRLWDILNKVSFLETFTIQKITKMGAAPKVLAHGKGKTNA